MVLVDRSNMAVAIVAISGEHGYSKPQQGMILASFFFGYILTPILGGTFADRYGGKTVLAIGVAHPSIHAMIGTWIPPDERSKAVATVTAFGYMGSVLALPTSSALVVSPWGWRSIFWLFGSLGLSWSVVWQVLGASDPTSCTWISRQEMHWIIRQQQQDQIETNHYHLATGRDPSSEHSDDNDPMLRTDPHGLTAESSSLNADAQPLSRWQMFRNQVRSQASKYRQLETTEANKEAVPWKALLARREVWAIILSQFFNSFGFFIMQSWIPTFYLDYYGVDVGKIGFYAAAIAMMLITIGMALNGFTLTGASAYQ
ncbi:hypothetical protein BGZ65_002905, partial [Modicella reniformis]